MTARTEPFWNAAYRADARPFGDPSAEILALRDRLPAGARVLDLGSGDGRNALPLALAGHYVTAVDVSKPAIRAIHRAADRDGVDLEVVHADLRTFSPLDHYHLVIAHGVLHLLDPPDRDALIERIRGHTLPGGWNVLAVFTDHIPPPPDLADLCSGLFMEGELLLRYNDWEVEDFHSYVLEDEHPGGLRHRHPINKVVARRP